MKERQRPNNSDLAEFYKLSPGGLCVYCERVFEQEKYMNSISNLFENGDNFKTYEGEMNSHSRRRLSRCLYLLLEIAERKKVTNPSNGKKFNFKVAFITLTLSAPQYPYTDKDIKKNLLEKWIRKMRSKGMRNYVWKAEQQQNGNIHFHILTDTFILHTDIRDTWNNIQNDLQFIDYFEKKHGHKNPNSTDVHAVSAEKETVRYLLKYMLKKSDKTDQLRLDKDYSNKSKGKVWDCSLNLKLKNTTAEYLDSTLWAKLVEFKKLYPDQLIEEDFYKFFFLNATNRKDWIPQKYLQPYESYLNDVRTYYDKTDKGIAG